MNTEVKTDIFELYVTVGKALTMLDELRHEMYFDMNEIDETAQAFILNNHEKHNNLFAILEDYVQELGEQITALNEKVN